MEQGLEAVSEIVVELHRGIRTVVQAMGSMKELSAKLDAMNTRLNQIDEKVGTKKEDKSG